MAKRHKHTLGERRRRFVEAFMGPAAGNAAEAARMAGYSKTHAKQAGSRMLTFVDVQQAIMARVQKCEATSIATAVERDELLSTFARDCRAELRDRIKAIAELNKCSGRHSIKHAHEGKLTFAQIIAGSREATP